MSIQVRSNEKPQTLAPGAANSEVHSTGSDSGTSVNESQSKENQASPSAPDPKESEQNASSESDPEKEVETKTEGESQENEEDHPKKKGGFQRRIDKLNAQKAQAQQELEYWKQMALKSAGTESKNNIDPRQTQSAPISMEEKKPNPDHFETHAEYVEALTDWKTEQKLKERDQRAAKERIDQEQSKIVSSYSDRMKVFSDKTPDFQDVLAEVDHVPLSPALREIILNSDNGPQLAYELAKLPGEYERIAKLPPLACAREMGKFEAQFSSSSSKGSTEGTKKITRAPKPIEPVGTGGKGSVPKSIFDPHLSQSEYEALRREQIKKRRQVS